VGESVVHDGWRFNVEEIDGRRVRRVRITYVSAGPSSRDVEDPGPDAQAG
jgi:CBS domain containing-hemolysin-like protein